MQPALPGLLYFSARVGGGSQSTPDTVPSGLNLSALPEYARSILVPGARIDRNMLLALNPGATIQQIDNALMSRLGRHLLYEGERERASGVVSMEWRPHDDLDLYLDTLVAGKQNHMLSEMMNAGTRANTPIPIGMADKNQDDLNQFNRKTLPDMMSAAVQGTNKAYWDAARPTADLVMPALSEHAMGQLMQMLMLATVVEGDVRRAVRSSQVDLGQTAPQVFFPIP